MAEKYSRTKYLGRLFRIIIKNLFFFKKKTIIIKVYRLVVNNLTRSRDRTHVPVMDVSAADLMSLSPSPLPPFMTSPSLIQVSLIEEEIHCEQCKSGRASIECRGCLMDGKRKDML